MPPPKITVAELKGLASKARLKNYSKLDKTSLIKFLEDNKVMIPDKAATKPKAITKPKAATKPKAIIKPKAATKPKAIIKPKAATKPKATGKKVAKPKVATSKPKETTKSPKVILRRWSYETSEVAGAMCEGASAPEAWANLSRKLSDKIEKKFLEGKVNAKVKHHKASYEVTFGDLPSIKGRIHLPDGSYTFKAPLRRS